MGKAKRRKQHKDAHRAASLLDDDSEAFQNKLDDIHVRDITREKDDSRSTYEDSSKYQSEIKELKPITEEARPYELLMSTLGSSKSGSLASLLKKRKFEESAASQPVEKKQKKEHAKVAKEEEESEGESVVEEEEEEAADWTEEKKQLAAAAKADSEKALKKAEKTDYEVPQGEEEEEKEKNEVAIALTEGEAETDTYRLQYDRNISEEDINVSTTWNELETSSTFGRVFSNKITKLPEPVPNFNYNVKQRIVIPWNHYVTKNFLPRKKSKKNDVNNLILTSLQSQLFPIINNYHDVLMTNQNYKNSHEIQSLYTLHVLNHVMKIRDRVIRNNSRLAQPNVDPDLELRDQGFTRPRVLVLLPTRNACWEFVERMLKFTPKIQSDRVAHKRKFHDEFYNETTINKARKPEDFTARFKGNNDDNFRLGIAFTHQYCRLYSEFNHSDIIVASPLGLKLSIEGNNGDVDFLSSIEVVVVDSAENTLMQNWDHLSFLFKNCNTMPKEYHGVDVTRIRMSFIDTFGKHLRQTLIFSEVNHVLVNNLFNKFCFNISGKVKLLKSSNSGTVCQVLPQVKQLFQRLDVNSPTEVDDARFNYFCSHVYPNLITDLQQGVMIFIPSYLDFVRVRNFMRVRRKKGDVDFVQCCEYTPPNHVSRNRAYFESGRRDFMLFTERFHFFNRYSIKGIKKIVFYSLPTFPQFYPEMLNLLPDGGTCLSLFTKFDLYQLEPIVGQKRSSLLLTAEKTHHLLQ
eukprot:TRINITY_DN7560_c0_g1_i1.p1 TRINITY_DN7560_c0_g1~~TRINITY_DN7560_c0_g1_i1.p1  ORF type:complete len:744 (+),score=204.58 TRINITY_DN7560_c0_g1_i1:67-2298(+)